MKTQFKTYLGSSCISLSLLMSTACSKPSDSGFQGQAKRAKIEVNSEALFDTNADQAIKDRYAIEIQTVLDTTQEVFIKDTQKKIAATVGDDTLEYDGFEYAYLETSVGFLSDLLEWSESVSPDMTLREQLEDLGEDVSVLENYDTAIAYAKDLSDNSLVPEMQGLYPPTDPESLEEWGSIFESEDQGGSAAEFSLLQNPLPQRAPVPPKDCGSHTRVLEGGVCRDKTAAEFASGAASGEAKSQKAFNQELIKKGTAEKTTLYAVIESKQQGLDWHAGQMDMMYNKYKDTNPETAQSYFNQAAKFRQDADYALGAELGNAAQVVTLWGLGEINDIFGKYMNLSK